MSGGYHVVASSEEVPEGQTLPVELNGEEILLCNHQGKFYAIAYYCSHDQFPLEGGLLHEGCIECPYHGALFNLVDGSVAAPPAFESIKTYPVRVEADLISVQIVE